jgi:hypothetical protein
MTSEDRNRADARFNKAARAATEAKSGKTDREAALKAVTDNMAKLKALRLAREAAQPPAAALKKTRAKSKKPGKKPRRWPTGWRGSKAAAAGPRLAGLDFRHTGAGHSIIDRVLVAASYTWTCSIWYWFFKAMPASSAASTVAWCDLK